METATVAKERAEEDVWRLIGELEAVTARLKEALEKAELNTYWLKEKEEGDNAGKPAAD